MSKRFEGKVALVTGAATGIGRGGALYFAKEGAKVVVVTSSNVKGAEETVAMIRKDGGEAAFIQCDVRDEASVEAMVAGCVKTYGRLDYAFNNAGVGPDGVRLPVIDITDCSAEIWNKTIDTNLTGVFFCLKHEMRQMKKQGAGVIVNFGSIWGDVGAAGVVAYCASKGAVHNLTRAMALDHVKDGIRINAVCPGEVNTPMLASGRPEPPTPEDLKKLGEAVVPMGRLADPAEIARVVVFLASEGASYMTGSMVTVDAGYTAR